MKSNCSLRHSMPTWASGLKDFCSSSDTFRISPAGPAGTWLPILCPTKPIQSLKVFNLSRYFSTFLCTKAAKLGAFLAMIMHMASTLVGAFFANFGTEGAYLPGQLTVPCKYSCSEPTHLGTVHIQRDTARHHSNILFCQACRRAVITGRSTFVTGLDTGRVRVMSH